MTPGVVSNVVTVLQTTHSTIGPVNHVRTNVEHGRLELVLLEVVVESVVRAVRTIIVRQTPGLGLRAVVNVCVDVLVLGNRACRRTPPAVGVRVRVVVAHVERTIRIERTHRDIGHRRPVNRVVQVPEFSRFVHAVRRGSFPNAGPFALVKRERLGLVVNALRVDV